jgi:hypothetical protein
MGVGAFDYGVRLFVNDHTGPAKTSWGMSVGSFMRTKLRNAAF